MEKPAKIAPAKGKLGVLLPGMGAVSTTFMAGVELVRKGKAQPIGSLTQLGTVRLGKRTDGTSPLIKKFVPLADLNDLQVELDISQNDFAKLHSGQHGTVTTDAFPDRKYDGIIHEISPEANRQKATVQIKVKVQTPDDYLRPEMNASVAFVSDEKVAAVGAQARPVILIPAAAIHDNVVFVMLDGRAIKRAVKTGSTNSKGVRIEDGLIGGEDLILNPPANLKDGDRVKAKQA